MTRIFTEIYPFLFPPNQHVFIFEAEEYKLQLAQNTDVALAGLPRWRGYLCIHTHISVFTKEHHKLQQFRRIKVYSDFHSSQWQKSLSLFLLSLIHEASSVL